MYQAEYHLVLTKPTSTTIVTSKGAYVIEEDGTVRFIPEMPLDRQLEAFRAAAALVQSTARMKGPKGLQQETAKFLTSLTRTITQEVAAKEAVSKAA